MQAVLLVRDGWTVRKVARRFGVSPGTVSKWVARAPCDGRMTIPTRSSQPHTSPNRIDPVIEQLIVDERTRSGRCGQVVHHVLTTKHGVSVSLPTVQRVLKRRGLITERSPWKRRHTSEKRPKAVVPGALVEVDTIHLVPRYRPRFYVYTLLDVHSRWAWARVSERINTHRTIHFVRTAQRQAPFSFSMLQSDHGSEFSQNFTERIGLAHRHSRVRTPNDNAHLERFNRTIQDECFSGLPQRLDTYMRVLPAYLKHYNETRPHMGIGYQTPMEKINEVFPRS